jgi:hypothetical protein
LTVAIALLPFFTAVSRRLSLVSEEVEDVLFFAGDFFVAVFLPLPTGRPAFFFGVAFFAAVFFGDVDFFTPAAFGFVAALVVIFFEVLALAGALVGDLVVDDDFSVTALPVLWRRARSWRLLELEAGMVGCRHVSIGECRVLVDV